MDLVTCTAPVNIAVVKYWGKRDEKLILPINDSLSVTLSQGQMQAKTTVAASEAFAADRIWLNGREETVEGNPRLVNCLNQVRKAAAKGRGLKVHICSENNFPTAAGLASSAAGYACLVYALCELFEVTSDRSVLARMGSGSACRSVFGGFVEWRMGRNPDGSDSAAKQLFPASHWPQLHVLILVANDARKKVPSSKGMKLSVETSQLLKHRAEVLVPETMKEMKEAIEAKNLAKFAELTMKDSNQLHAVCLDTFPPCVYMNGTSHSVAELVHEVNEAAGRTVAGYTFDAGPNACLYLLEADVALLASVLRHFFPSTDERFFRGEEIRGNSEVKAEAESLISKINAKVNPKDSLKYVIHTKVGDGPKRLHGEDDHLLDRESGLPK